MNHLERNCEGLDAAVFSSDMMYDPERYAMFKEYLSRWNRAVEEHNKAEMTDATPPAQPAPVQHFNHTSAANSALRDAQNRSYQIAKLSQPAPVQDAENKWRTLALQFDAHRMSALAHLRAMVQDPAKHAEVAGEFLSAPPPGQPAVPDAIGPNEDELPAYAAGWNDCRAEMLKGMKP
jgi:hypothetical protein